MCGIAGIFNLAGGRINRAVLDNMTDILAHRGPDGRGIYIDGGIGLGHRRLAIIDIEFGAQPMSDSTNRFHITFNGEIYNYRELRRHLETKGHTFRTRSDTEVLLHTYMEYGENCVERLNGMFAFAIWDSAEHKLFLARDRSGIKPLYYAMAGDNFIFASEIKSLLLFPGLKREPNLKVLGFYLAHYQTVMGDETLFKGIHNLPHGYCMTVIPDKLHWRCYWKLPVVPESEKEEKTEQYYIDGVRELVTKSVDRQLISDVPLGAYLSGGLDSSILVGLMADKMDSQLKTFAIGFPEEGFNEFKYSGQAAAAWGTDHTQITMEEDDYFKAMGELIRFKDAPLSVPNEVPLYLMSKILKERITVVLSGEGADELFGGYGVILRSPIDYYRSRMDLPKNQRKLLNNALMRLYGKTTFDSELDHFLSVYRWFNQNDINSIFDRNVLENYHEFTQIADFWRRRFNAVDELDLYNKYLYMMETVHLPCLLNRLDVTTMAASVEGRVPFTDPELLHFVSYIPHKYKLHWNTSFHESICMRLNAMEISETLDTTKYILKRSFVDKVPPDILFRKKYSFPVPLDRWFTKSLSQLFLDLTMDGVPDFFDREGLLKWASGNYDRDKALKVWMAANVLMWYKEYFTKSESFKMPETAVA
ncbi:asparagine synthase (glutamine-hydrolyzing) [bacterium]|nr:asparagine synthase (glutamine-hydrolyzing) [FCB group bacterium]MBL7190135.1 asparagine synthase (glutamine-hydrolyzing) [bacterium]